MQTLTYTGPAGRFEQNVLTDQLIAAIPALVVEREGERHFDASVSGKVDGSEVTIEVQDEIDAAAVEAVIAAHDGSYRRPDVVAADEREQSVTDLRGELERSPLARAIVEGADLSAWTIEEQLAESQKLLRYLLNASRVALPDWRRELRSS